MKTEKQNNTGLTGHSFKGISKDPNAPVNMFEKEELQNLKDLIRKTRLPLFIGGEVEINEVIVPHELKTEAIKWVKEDIEEHYNLFKDILNGREIKSPTMNLIKKWMKRLNITEEDLK